MKGERDTGRGGACVWLKRGGNGDGVTGGCMESRAAAAGRYHLTNSLTHHHHGHRETPELREREEEHYWPEKTMATARLTSPWVAVRARWQAWGSSPMATICWSWGVTGRPAGMAGGGGA